MQVIVLYLQCQIFAIFFMKILFLAPYPPFVSPSQRFRFEHYLPFLKEQNIEYKYYSFVNMSTWQIMFTNGNFIKKVRGVVGGFIKRFLLLFTMLKYDFIFIHREVTPAGPPIFEFIISKILRKNIIYDFDDAIWISLSSKANPIAKRIKCTWKVAYICKMSQIVTVGNDFLATYARQFCKDVRIIPTVVDTNLVHNKIKEQTNIPITIGWTGTFTNFDNLEIILDAIYRLQLKYDFVFLIIADKDPLLQKVNYTYLKWNKSTEIEDLLKMNIGIMPLLASDIQLGKCAFKAIQYMALGIPAVVSPVGANCVIVENNINGYWADNNEEWYEKLELLIIDKMRREMMGNYARQRIVNHYSVESSKGAFFKLVH
jgi:glycosyltransferase involved in cell wall biosynthesis